MIELGNLAPSKVLNYKGDIPGAANLNNYTVTGVYGQAMDAQASSGTNYPEPQSGTLEVINFSDGYFVFQRYTTYNSPNVYVRRRYNAGWSAWTEIWSNNNVVVTGTSGQGQLKLPNGVLIQWGAVQVSYSQNVTGWTTITYPIAYKSTPAVFASDMSGVFDRLSVNNNSSAINAVFGYLSVNSTSGWIQWVSIGI